MAVIDYIPEVKTLAGYDALSTISTYTNHVATAVSNTGSTYNITVKAPTEILTGKSFTLMFIPNIDNLVNMQVSINGATAIPILVNGVAISAGVLKTNILYSLLIDNVNSKAFFNSVEVVNGFSETVVGKALDATKGQFLISSIIYAYKNIGGAL